MDEPDPAVKLASLAMEVGDAHGIKWVGRENFREMLGEEATDNDIDDILEAVFKWVRANPKWAEGLVGGWVRARTRATEEAAAGPWYYYNQTMGRRVLEKPKDEWAKKTGGGVRKRRSKRRRKSRRQQGGRRRKSRRKSRRRRSRRRRSRRRR